MGRIGIAAAPEQIISTVGATHGLDLVTRTLLSLPGAFAVLPDPANPDEHDPADAGTIAHGH